MPDQEISSPDQKKSAQEKSAQETSSPDEAALLLELQEAVGTVRHWQALGVQAAAFIVAANAVLIGYGFAKKHAGIFLVGSVLPLTLLAVYMITLSAAAGLIILSIRIEQELKIPEARSLATLYAKSYLKLKTREIVKMVHEGPPARTFKFRWLRKPTAIIVSLVFVGQVVLFCRFFAVKHHTFF